MAACPLAGVAHYAVHSRHRTAWPGTTKVLGRRRQVDQTTAMDALPTVTS
jgi:hypothetical protein